MRGSRLFVGAVAMGLIVPAVLFFLLELDTASEFFTTSATCFLAWGVADLIANVLAQPRLENRSPGAALRQWEESKGDGEGDGGDESGGR